MKRKTDTYLEGIVLNTREPPKEDNKKRTLKKIIRDKINQNEKLRDFLEENKLTGRFIKNLVNKEMRECEYWCNKEITEYQKNTIGIHIDSKRPIDRCFYWRNTTEGHDFWREKDEEYQRRYNTF